jgi:hypothetical protein
MVGNGDKTSRATDPVKLVPYVLNDGVPTFRDSEIRYLWDRAVADDALDSMFLDRKSFSSDDFLEFINRDDVNFFVAFDKNDPAVLILMTNIVFGRAECHYFFFKSFRGLKAIRIGQRCLKILSEIKTVDSTYVYDTIIGITPVRNKAACRVLETLNMKAVGIIPGYIYNAKTKQQEDIIYSYYCRG